VRSARQIGNILPLDHDTHHRLDSGYTGWIELDDGRFFAVNGIRLQKLLDIGILHGLFPRRGVTSSRK